LLSSCNKISDSDTLNGTWKLKTISGGFAGISISYSEDAVNWYIVDSSLHIVNTDSLPPYGLLDSGVYKIRTKIKDNQHVILIDNDEFGSFTLDKNDLIILESYVDGFTYHFQK
jgi:hypothetical protein